MERPLFRVAHLVLLFAIRDWPGDQTRFKRRRAPFPAPGGRSVLLKTGTQYVVRVAAAARRTSRILDNARSLRRPGASAFCAFLPLDRDRRRSASRPWVPSLGPRWPRGPARRRAAGPAMIAFQARPCRSPHALATVLRVSLTGFDRSPKPGRGRRSPEDSSPFDGSLRPMSGPTPAARPAAGALRRRRSLRQGRQGDTVEAIAPDAAALRSRHVARRTGSTIIPLLRFVLDGSLGYFPTR